MFNSEDGSLVLCGAKSKRNAGRPCQQPAMKNRKCRLHGGKCAGPITKKGLLHCKRANWKHGFYSHESFEERKTIKNLIFSIKNQMSF